MANFEQALSHLKKGKKAARTGWNGPDQWIQAQYPDEHSKMSIPYIYIFTQQAQLVPWLASQGDLFAEDWELR